MNSSSQCQYDNRLFYRGVLGNEVLIVSSSGSTFMYDIIDHVII